VHSIGSNTGVVVNHINANDSIAFRDQTLLHAERLSAEGMNNRSRNTSPPPIRSSRCE
jgi:hypothetical protein